jgi:hypothetical protein
MENRFTLGNKYHLKTMIFIAILQSMAIDSFAQTSQTLSSNTPLIFTSMGTGIYNQSVLYHDSNNGFLLALAKLSNSDSATPMDFHINARGGNHPFFTIKGAYGNVGIGTTTPSAKLNIASTADEVIIAVTPTGTTEDVFRVMGNGHVWATKIVVQIAPFPDYVFNPNYKLMSLENLQDYIVRNHRLPNMPSAEEVEKNGVDVGEINRILVEKVEELTLYIIALQKQVDALKIQK